MRWLSRAVAGVAVALAAGAAAVAPAAASPGDGVAAPRGTVQPAFTSPYTPVGSDNPPIAYVDLGLDESTGLVVGEIFSLRGEIQGSVVRLETSGYRDFRNVPYSWPATVPANSTSAITPFVPYNAPGENWWWRTCGWVGSRYACTGAYRFQYAAGLGWSICGPGCAAVVAQGKENVV